MPVGHAHVHVLLYLSTFCTDETVTLLRALCDTCRFVQVVNCILKKKGFKLMCLQPVIFEETCVAFFLLILLQLTLLYYVVKCNLS